MPPPANARPALTTRPQHSTLRLLLGLHLVSMTGRGVFFAVSALYFTQVVGLDVQGVGLALTVAAGVGVAASYVMGLLADRVPARHLIAASLGVEAAALLALPWASTLVVLGVLAGIESGMNRGAATARQTLVARVFLGPERTVARARMRVVTNLGIGLGSGAAAFVLLADSAGAFRIAMSAAALSYLVAAGLAIRLPADRVRQARTERTPSESPRRSPWRDRRYLALTCVNGGFVVHFSIIEVGLPIWLVTQTEAPAVLVSVMLLLNTALVVLLQVRLNRGFEQVGRAGRGYLAGGWLLGAATLAYAVAAAGGPIVASLVLLAGGVAHALGEILTSGAGFSLSFELAEAGAPGAYQGLYGTGQAVGIMLGPALATFVIAVGPAGWLLYAGAFAVLGLAGRAIARNDERRAPPEPVPEALDLPDQQEGRHMQITQVGAAFAAERPSRAGAWVDEHLGFRVLVDLGWYVSTQHPDLPGLRVDFVRHDHETWVEPTARVRGTMLALEVQDVDDQHERLTAAGVRILMPLVTEPWGQRRLQVAGPGGIVVELVQPVPPDPEWMAAQGLSPSGT